MRTSCISLPKCVLYIFVVAIGIVSPVLEGANCDDELEAYRVSGNTIPENPGRESLEEAAFLFSVSPAVGQCVFPDVVVIPISVGEYEKPSDAPIQGTTLSGRAEYRWGKHKLVQGILKSGFGFDLKAGEVKLGQAIVTSYSDGAAGSE